MGKKKKKKEDIPRPEKDVRIEGEDVKFKDVLNAIVGGKGNADRKGKEK